MTVSRRCTTFSPSFSNRPIPKKSLAAVFGSAIFMLEHFLLTLKTNGVLVECTVFKLQFPMLCSKHGNYMTVIIMVGFSCDYSRSDRSVPADVLG